MINLERNTGRLDTIRSGLYQKKQIVDVITKFNAEGKASYSLTPSGKIDYKTLHLDSTKQVEKILEVAEELVNLAIENLTVEKLEKEFKQHKFDVQEQLKDFSRSNNLSLHSVLKSEIETIIMYQFKNLKDRLVFVIYQKTLYKFIKFALL